MTNFKKPNDADLSNLQGQHPQEGQSNIGRGADIHSQHVNSARKNAKSLEEGLLGEDASKKSPQKVKSKQKADPDLSGALLKDFDFEALEQFEKELEDDQRLLDDFKKNPDKVIREEGVQLPEGYKLSFNENAPQGDKKIEIRMGRLLIKQ